MEGVIILAHGSRRQETDRILDSLTKKVTDRATDQRVIPAYLQFSPNSLDKAVEQLVGEGVTRIKVIPMFLFDGIHVTEDIPEELEAMGERYPEVDIRMSRHLGDDDRIADIILDRMASLQWEEAGV